MINNNVTLLVSTFRAPSTTDYLIIQDPTQRLKKYTAQKRFHSLLVSYITLSS